jgi:TrmH family RNA methyltransferase
MPTVVEIYSENNDFQHADVLKRNREKRQKNREFFIEGVKPIELALQSGWHITGLLYPKDKPVSDWAKNILATSEADKHYAMPSSLMEKLSDKEEPSELIALAKMREDDFDRIPIQQNFLVVVFDRPASPGNLGTIIRTCASLGVHGLIITGHAADLYDTKTIRASVGALFTIPVIRKESHKEVLAWTTAVKQKHPDLQIVGTSAKATTSLAYAHFNKPTIVLIGNETWGLSAAYKESCDILVTIPMQGNTSSLNVASATSIVLYEIQRQRHG